MKLIRAGYVIKKICKYFFLTSPLLTPLAQAPVLQGAQPVSFENSIAHHNFFKSK